MKCVNNKSIFSATYFSRCRYMVNTWVLTRQAVWR